MTEYLTRKITIRLTEQEYSCLEGQARDKDKHTSALGREYIRRGIETNWTSRKWIPFK